MKKKLVVLGIIVVLSLSPALVQAFPPGTLEGIVKEHSNWGCCTTHDAVRVLKLIWG